MEPNGYQSQIDLQPSTVLIRNEIYLFFLGFVKNTFVTATFVSRKSPPEGFNAFARLYF